MRKCIRKSCMIYYFTCRNLYSIGHGLRMAGVVKRWVLESSGLVSNPAPSVSQFSSVAQSCPTLLRPHGLQLTRLPCPSPTPEACSNSCPLSQWCHPTISSSVVPFSSCLQTSPASGSFPTSPFFASDEFQLQHQSFQWIFRTYFL